MHEWEIHMQLYLNISWLEIYCTVADKKLGILYLHGPPNWIWNPKITPRLRTCLGGTIFSPLKLMQSWGTGQGLTFRDTSNVSVLSALSFSKFDVIQEWIMARYISMSDTQVSSSSIIMHSCIERCLEIFTCTHSFHVNKWHIIHFADSIEQMILDLFNWFYNHAYQLIL